MVDDVGGNNRRLVMPLSPLMGVVTCVGVRELDGVAAELVGVNRSSGLVMTRGVDTRRAGSVLADVDFVEQLDDSLLVSCADGGKLPPAAP